MTLFGRLIIAILVCNVGFSHGNKVKGRKRSEADSMERELLTLDDDVDLSELSSSELSDIYIENTGALSSDMVCVNEEEGLSLSKPRALPFYAGRGDGVDTVADCSKTCREQNYLISGRSDHGKCFCAEELGYEDSVSGNSILYNQYGINTACDCTNIDTADVGHGLVCVSVITVQVEFVGCFNDDVPRTLPIEVGSGISYFGCALECYARHYEFFGRQYDKECWCGTGATHAIYGEANEGDCNCDGNDIGYFKQCVYKIPDGKFTPNHIHIGCFADENDDRALPNRQTDGDGSIEACSEACTDNFYNLFGLQFDMECWCGRANVDDPYKHGASNECDCDSLVNIGMNVFCLFAIGKPEPTSLPTFSSIPSAVPSLSAVPSIISAVPSIISAVPSDVPSLTFEPTFEPTFGKRRD